MSDPVDADLYAYPDVDRPWLRVNMVGSVDGSAQGPDGLSGSLGTEADRACFEILRSLADVVLVSAGTARAEEYGPVDGALLALVSRSLDVPERLRVPGVLVVAPASADGERAAALAADGVEVLRSGDDEVDWAGVLDELERRGLRHILCEGGPTLLADLAEQDLVDELCLTIAPVLVAGDGPRIAHGPGPLDRPLRLGHAVTVDGTLLTRWERDRA